MLTHKPKGQVHLVLVSVSLIKALKIAREIEDKGNESIWLNNLGIVLEAETKYLKELEEKLGKKEFEKLAAEVAPRMEELVRKMLEWTLE